MGRVAATRLASGARYPYSGGTPLAAFSLTTAPDGGWIWFTFPSAVTYGDYTYIAYVDNAGDVSVRAIHNLTLTVSNEVALANSFQVDDHVNPALLVRSSDHKLMIWFSRHAGSAMFQVVSSQSLDTDPTLSSGVASAVNLDSQLGGNAYTYATPFEYSGTLYLFYRNTTGSSDRQWSYATSGDDGATWSSGTSFFAQGQGYVVVRHDGAGTFHFMVSNSSPNISTTSIGHMTWDRTDWKQSDGTTILGSLPHQLSDATTVWNTANSYPWDVGFDGAAPVLTFYSYEGNTHHARYAKYDAGWNVELIEDTGDGIKSATNDGTSITGGVYPGGATLDPADGTILYLSRQVGSAWEIEKRVTADDGATWTTTVITSGSGTKNIRPVVPLNHGSDLKVLWMRGTYANYTSWNTGTWGSAV